MVLNSRVIVGSYGNAVGRFFHHDGKIRAGDLPVTHVQSWNCTIWVPFELAPLIVRVVLGSGQYRLAPVPASCCAAVLDRRVRCDN